MPFAYPSESSLQSFLADEFIAAAGIMARKKTGCKQQFTLKWTQTQTVLAHTKMKVFFSHRKFSARPQPIKRKHAKKKKKKIHKPVETIYYK